MIDSTNDMDHITEYLWLGNFKSANNINNLKKEGIKKILTIMDKTAPFYLKKDNFNHKIIKVSDMPTSNIIRHLGECLNFIKGNDKILVHCMSGASRSASIVIAYIMWDHKKTFDDAFNFVNKIRPVAFPNFGFREQLKIFEKLLKENDYDINKIDFNNLKKYGKSIYFDW